MCMCMNGCLLLVMCLVLMLSDVLGGVYFVVFLNRLVNSCFISIVFICSSGRLVGSVMCVGWWVSICW